MLYAYWPIGLLARLLAHVAHDKELIDGLDNEPLSAKPDNDTP